MTKLTNNIKSASDVAKDTLATAKTKAAHSVKSSKQIAAKAAEKSADTIDKNPIAIVLGGLALGAIVGALLPKTQQEQKLFGSTGRKLNNKAKAIAGAAKSAGKDKIDSLGINSETARDQFRDLVGKATEAVKAAGQAATDAARKRD
jgi:ElaB/YqjD/DUF883 family membrane-anchored ribosome-binding protein